MRDIIISLAARAIFTTSSQGGALNKQDEFETVSRTAQVLNMKTNTTSTFVDELQWSATKSIRSSIITLAIFNILAALATLTCIGWDCYKAAWRDNRHLTSSKRKLLRFDSIGPLQVYPLILCVGIIIQGIIFARVQTKGLEDLLIIGCVPHASVMFPATFIVPYIQAIFSIETTIRSMPRVPFLTRAKWVVPACLAVTVLCLIITLCATVSNRPPDACYASLFWFIQQWRRGAFGIFFIVTAILTICGFTIFFRLRRSPTFLKASEERLAASQMVYWIAVAMISNMLMIPFFGIISFSSDDASPTQAAESAQLASIVANLSGLMTGGLYLFLRTSRKAIIDTGHRFDPDAPRPDEKAEVIMISGALAPLSRSNSQQRLSHISVDHASRCTSPYSASLYDEYTGDDRDESLGEKVRPSFETSRTGKTMPKSQFAGFSITKPPKSKKAAEKAPEKGSEDSRDSVASRPTTASTSTGRGLHSIFSQKNVSIRSPSVGLLPATTYSPGNDRPDSEAVMAPPPLIFTPKGHQSTLSTSSATVQIGLKIVDTSDARPTKSAHRNLQRAYEISSSRSGVTSVPSTSSHAARMLNHSKGRRNSSVDLRNKELPSIPNLPGLARGHHEDIEIQLDATTYNPKRTPKMKFASPTGLNFGGGVPRSPFQKAAQFMTDRWSTVRESGSQWF